MKNVTAERSSIMRAVKSKDTKPELIVRKLLFGMGFRYRLHCSELPGSPDIVFTKKRKVIFVHGCFWHGHDCKRGDRLPSTNVGYWEEKIANNVRRFEEQTRSLENSGWKVCTVWECELKDVDGLTKRLGAFLSSCKG